MYDLPLNQSARSTPPQRRRHEELLLASMEEPDSCCCCSQCGEDWATGCHCGEELSPPTVANRS